MFEAKEYLSELVDRLYALCQPLKRGEVLPHSQIEAVLGVPPHQGHWQHCMNRLRRRMEDERGITLWPEITHGYKLLLPHEQLQVPVIRTRRALRQVAKGERSLEALPEKGLTAHQRRVRALRLGHAADMQKELRAKVRTMELLARPAATQPRPGAAAQARPDSPS
jgi:hypothetical protein